MFEIDIKLEDNHRRTNKSYLKLNPSPFLQPMMGFPIEWTGKLNDIDLIIVQLSQSCYDEQDFIFKVFPQEYNYLKGQIIKSIHLKMNKIN